MPSQCVRESCLSIRVTPNLLRPFLSSRAISAARETVRYCLKSKLPTSGLLPTLVGHADTRSATEKEKLPKPAAPPPPFPCGITTYPPSGRGRIYPAPYRPDLQHRCSGQRAGAEARRGRPCPQRWRNW